MMHIGVDQHKRFSQVAVMDSEGKVVEERRLYHDDREVMREFFRRWRESTGVLEAGRHWEWLYDLMEGELESVKLSNPYRTRLIAEARVKTDKIDARVLAQLSRTGFLPEAYAPRKEIRGWRELHRFRMRLVRIQTGLKNQVHGLLDRQGIEHVFTDVFGKKGRAFLSGLRLEEPYGLELKVLLELLDHIASQVKKIRGELRQRLKKEPEGVELMTVPGLGEVLSYLVLYEIGDIGRFLTAKRFASYCALTPSTRQSAEHTYWGSIGRRGNLYLKWAFVEAAHVAVRTDPFMRAVYTRIVRKRKSSGKAIIAVARHLATAVYFMLRRGEPYRSPHTGRKQ